MRILWFSACAMVAALGLGETSETARGQWWCYYPPSPPPIRYEERTITCYRPEYRTEYRNVQRTVYRLVPETQERELTETVLVPKWHDVQRQRTVLVPETREETRQRTIVAQHRLPGPFDQLGPHRAGQDERGVVELPHLEKLPDHHHFEHRADSSGHDDVGV